MTIHLFPGKAAKMDQFVKAIFNGGERQKWDQSFLEVEVQEQPSFNQTLFWKVIHKPLLQGPLRKNCEAFLKLFIFREG